MTAFAMPSGACDCHNHVVGAQADYPMDPDRVYTAGIASVDDLLAHRRLLGISRTVLIQASFYGTDNTCMLDGLVRLGDSGRGVAVLKPDVPDAELDRLHGLGVRGVRVNLETSRNRDPKVAADLIGPLSERLARLGWHIQVYAGLSVIAALAPQLAKLPVKVVIDHFGRASAAAGLDQPGLPELLDLVRGGNVYVKLSGARHVSSREDRSDVAPLARALIAAGRDRMVWGTDWPHTTRRADGSRTEIAPYEKIDDVAQLDLLRGWCGSEEEWRLILAENPARLYAF
ncbi:amidohydrolase family protein [Aquabacter sp. CN5-332]|uniref:amidohydrolase family protein n=1 Tax=Aquabacter sp. CN5-332 TaxID=3156608 RepID=UPI0032B38F3C